MAKEICYKHGKKKTMFYRPGRKSVKECPKCVKEREEIMSGKNEEKKD